MEKNKYRDKGYWDMVRISNEDTDYPINMGKKWTDEEENTLLQELDKNIDIETIAQQHSRTIGGINCRRKDIAYTMYLQNISIEEIIIKTKLNNEQITETITKKENTPKRVKVKTEPIIQPKKLFQPKKLSLENEVTEMRIEIKELKDTIKELVEMMKAVYEFEDA